MKNWIKYLLSGLLLVMVCAVPFISTATVSNTNNRTSLTASGGTDFDFTFKIFSNTDIDVYVVDQGTGVATLQTLTTHYTVEIDTTSEGGTVTFLSAPTSGDTVLMIRDVPYTQTTDIPVNSGFSERVIENAYDKIVMQIQQVVDTLSKTIQLATTSTTSDVTLSDPEVGKFLFWQDSTTIGNSTVATIDTGTIEDGAITTVKLDTDAVTNAKIADDQIDSEHYVDGSIDEVHLEAGQRLTAGLMMIWPTDTAPSGWLLADGSCVSRTTYADLFAVISTTYDNSCGGSDFGLPDLRGRFPLGQDDMGGTSANRVTDTDADTLGNNDGDETKNLAHTHNVPTADYDFGINTTNPTAGFLNTSPEIDLSDGKATNDITSDSGGSATQDIMPPFITLNYIIKT